MSKRHFSTLLVVAIVVAVAITLMPGKTGRDSEMEPGLLWPDVGTDINQASRIEVTTAGGQLVATLVRGEDRWVIEELSGYPADFSIVRDLLAGLARAEVVEVKTSNPSYYQRLGVEDVAAGDAQGALVAITLADDVIEVIIGNHAQGREGMYVRMAGSDQSALIDVTFDVPRDPSGWADKEIADLAAAEVAEVEIIHPDGDWILVRKVSADDPDYRLENLPEGRELRSSWSVNSLGGVLASLNMDSVEPEQEPDFSASIKVRVLTFAGMEVTVGAIEDGGEHWIRLHASTPVDSLEAQSDEVAEMARDDLEAATERFNARVAGWAYRIPSYKFDAMNKRLEDLLKPLDDGES